MDRRWGRQAISCLESPFENWKLAESERSLRIFEVGAIFSLKLRSVSELLVFHQPTPPKKTDLARQERASARPGLAYPPHHIVLEHHFERQLNHSQALELAAGLSKNSPVHLLACQIKHWIVREIERFSPNPDGNLLCDWHDLQETEVPV